MHAKSPSLKSGVDLQSSRFRERLIAGATAARMNCYSAVSAP
jgi:hypothetical protein